MVNTIGKSKQGNRLYGRRTHKGCMCTSWKENILDTRLKLKLSLGGGSAARAW
jgi:hypothetical protein